MVDLKFVGVDGWDRPVYSDNEGNLWKDVNPFQDRQAYLCAATNNEFDGEPDYEFEYVPKFIPARAVWKRKHGRIILEVE